MNNPDQPRIRLATRNDIAAIQAIERQAGALFRGTDLAAVADDDPTDAETLAARIASSDLLVACFGDGPPIGFVMFHEVEVAAYVEEIAVVPDHAGQRIGAALLDEVGAMARARNWSALTLSTFRDVPWNAPYYRRLGFAAMPDETLSPGLLAIRAEHIARGLDETRRVFMRRDL